MAQWPQRMLYGIYGTYQRGGGNLCGYLSFAANIERNILLLLLYFAHCAS